MTTVTILPENPGSPGTRFRAVAGQAQSEGETVGAALDALSEQLEDSEAGMLVVVQSRRPDAFFTATQQHRLRELMDASRTARASGRSLAPPDQAELEALVEAELKGAAQRAAAIAGNGPTRP